jgi:hypothetical protein
LSRKFSLIVESLHYAARSLHWRGVTLEFRSRNLLLAEQLKGKAARRTLISGILARGQSSRAAEIEISAASANPASEHSNKSANSTLY